MTRPELSRRRWWRSRPARVAAAVLGVGALGAATAAYVQRARAEAQGSARHVAADTLALSRCVRATAPPPGPLQSRLLSPTGAPLARCLPPLESALERAAAHRRVRLSRAESEAEALHSALVQLRDSKALGRTGEELERSGGLEPVIDAIDRAALAACRLALREDARAEPCIVPTPRQPHGLPAARQLLTLDLAPSAPLVWRAFTRGDGQATVLLALSEGTRAELHALETRDAGTTFSSAVAPLPSGDPRDVRLTGMARPVVLHADGHASSARVASPGQLSAVVRLPPPPPGLVRVAAGTPVLELADGTLVDVLAPTEGERGGALRYHASGAAPRVRDVPSGLVAAGLAIHGPRVVTLRRAATEFAELDVFAVPSVTASFAEPQRVGIPYVPQLELTAEPENLCGIPGEKFSLLLGRGVYDALIALDPSKAFPFKLGAHPLNVLHGVCGACPPSALEHAETPLLHVPVRRTMAGFPVRPTRALATPSVRASSRAACSSDAVVITYVADGHVVVQTTERSGWTFGPPQVVAVPTAGGAATHAEVVGFRDRLLLLWLRRGPRRASLEALFLPATLR